MILGPYPYFASTAYTALAVNLCAGLTPDRRSFLAPCLPPDATTQQPADAVNAYVANTTRRCIRIKASDFN